MKCVITGGSKGIGLAIAKACVQAGYELLIVARNEGTLDRARQELELLTSDARVHTYSLDVRSRNAITEFGVYVAKTLGSVDILVNNAGTFTPGSVLDEAEGSLEFMMETNTYSAYYITRVLFPLIKKSDSGHIFNMCSIAALKAYPNGGSYSISKFAMLGFSKNLREELKPLGIKVTTVLPGATWTASWEGSGVGRERIMEAEDIAEVVMSSIRLGPKAVVEDIVVRPQLGDL